MRTRTRVDHLAASALRAPLQARIAVLNSGESLRCHSTVLRSTYNHPRTADKPLQEQVAEIGSTRQSPYREFCASLEWPFNARAPQ